MASETTLGVGRAGIVAGKVLLLVEHEPQFECRSCRESSRSPFILLQDTAMLVEFRIRNYRSYAAETRFSMVAGTGSELPGNTMTVRGLERHPLLRSAAIYGANASGKSNFARAFSLVRWLVLRSAESSAEGARFPVSPFLLDPLLAEEPSEFEVTFLLDGVRHQYGFITSNTRVHEEWLVVYPKGKGQQWFRRKVKPSGKSEWEWSTYLKGDKARLAERTHEDALFLAVAAQWNHEQLRHVQQWFKDRLRVLPRGVSTLNFTRDRMHKDSGFCEWLTGVLRAADVGIHKVRTRETGIAKGHIHFPSNLPKDVQGFLVEQFKNDHKVEIQTTRRLKGSKREVVWDLDEESDGTQRMLELLGPIREALEDGLVMVLDEIDTSLHPCITRGLVRLFNEPKSNPRQGQLIFTTHDTTLFDPTLFRCDQIWLAGKDATGATELYSLQDYSPRKGEPLQKGYLGGRYGGIPLLEPFGPVSREADNPEPVTVGS
jgi:AAA15 family ATPase/GTPase